MLLHLRLIPLHGVRSEGLKLDRQKSPQISRNNNQKNRNQAESAESECIQTMANQVNIQAVGSSHDGTKGCGCRTQNHCQYSQSETAIETETWQISPRKAFIQMECPEQVYRMTLLQNGGHKHS